MRGRRTRPAVAALGVLVVVGCAAAGAALAGRVGHESPYLVASSAIPQGSTMTSADLTTVEMQVPAGVTAVAAADEDEIVGRETSELVPAGAVINPADFATGTALPAGDAIVGASLGSSNLPPELADGNHILVVLTSSSSGLTGSASPGSVTSPASPTSTAHPGAAATPTTGTVLATGIVIEVLPAGSSAADADAAGTVVSIALPLAEAPTVAAASAANEISLAIAPETVKR